MKITDMKQLTTDNRQLTNCGQWLGGGYVAIASVLVITAIVLAIGTTVALLSVSDIQSALSYKKSEETLSIVEACIEDALLRLNEDNSIPNSITIPEGICSVTINSQSGGNWIFTVSSSLDKNTKDIQVEATRGSTVSITSWIEI
jgi:hypothetical protein